jgi:PqqD family protein of HPr-rel-A system
MATPARHRLDGAPDGPVRRWRAAGERPPLVRYWNGDYVVFNPPSGSTHKLDILSGEILAAVLAGDGEPEALCTRAAAFLEVENDAKLGSTVDAVLARLDEIGIIEPVER